MKDWNVSRRDLLKTLGVGAACLPLLNVTRAVAGPLTAPKRLLVIASTEGYRPMLFLPQVGPLATQMLPDTLVPLEPHKADIIVCPQMTNPAYTGCTRCGHGAYGTIYSGGPTRGGEGEYHEPAIPTVDQVVADAAMKLDPNLRMPTLPLHVQVDNSHSGTVGSNRCFWRGLNQPINPQGDPYVVYSMLFAGSTGQKPDPAAMRLLAQRKSILDFVGGDLQRFGRRLGSDDQSTIQGHLTAIREIEKALSGGAPGGPVMVAGDFTKMIDVHANANYPAIVDLQFNLNVAALASGTTAVVTVQLGDATGGGTVFDFVPGVPTMGNGYQTLRNWHDLGHRPVRPNGIDDKQVVDKWWMGKFAELIVKMKAVPEAGKTLLDNSVVLWGNHMESGDTHGAQAVPWMLAGSCQGYFKTGQCAASAGKPLNGVLAEICNAMGVPTPWFGRQDIGAPLAGLH
jgi:hypothetical protein